MGREAACAIHAEVLGAWMSATWRERQPLVSLEISVKKGVVADSRAAV